MRDNCRILWLKHIKRIWKYLFKIHCTALHLKKLAAAAKSFTCKRMLYISEWSLARLIYELWQSLISQYHEVETDKTIRNLIFIYLLSLVQFIANVWKFWRKIILQIIEKWSFFGMCNRNIWQKRKLWVFFYQTFWLWIYVQFSVIIFHFDTFFSIVSIVVVWIWNIFTSENSFCKWTKKSSGKLINHWKNQLLIYDIYSKKNERKKK